MCTLHKTIASSVLFLALVLLTVPYMRAEAALPDELIGIQLYDEGSYRTPVYTESNGGWSSYDTGAFDPDMARVYVSGASIPPNTDIRLCMQSNDSAWGGWPADTGPVRCTPWASQGGGEMPFVSGYPPEDFNHDRYRVMVESRTMPTNVSINNLQIAMQIADHSWWNNGCTEQFGDWARTGWSASGSSWSGLAHDGAERNDFNCMRLHLGVQVGPTPDTSVSFEVKNASKNTPWTTGPLTIASGNQIAFRWSATGYSNCGGSGSPSAVNFWTGGKTSNSGTQTNNGGNSFVEPPTGKTYTYGISCNYGSGTTGTYKEIKVSAASSVSEPNTTLRVENVSAGTPETTGNITINEGEQISFRWSATNSPTSCSASASPSDSAFSTGGRVSGTDTSVTEPAAGTYRTYAVECENAGGEDSDSIRVTTAAPAPVTTLFVTPEGDAETTDDVTIGADQEISLRWSATNSPTSCTASASPSDSAFSTGGQVAGTDSSVTEPSVGNAQTYTVTCTNTGGNHGDSLTVTRSILPPTLSVDDTLVRVGDTVSFTFNLNGNDAASCSFSGPGTPPSVSGASNPFMIAVQGTATYSLTCAGGTAAVTVNVLPQIFES